MDEAAALHHPPFGVIDGARMTAERRMEAGSPKGDARLCRGRSGAEMKPEATLDPADWDAVRELGHRMVEDMVGWLQTVRDRPVWKPVPAEIKESLRQPLPIEPQGQQRVYEDFLRDVLPWAKGNVHPRFWGWVEGTGTAFGMLAEMLAAGMNPNVNFGDHSAAYVERQVVDWCKEMLGYPAEASGILVSGASLANLTGLAVACNARAGFDVAGRGWRAAARAPRLYCSVETHSSITKAVELLGLGGDAIRRVAVGPDYRMSLPALRSAVAADRAAGLHPLCVIGNAGTVNTGAIDDLRGLADLCEAADLWLHVDGAFGALAALSPELRPLLAGLDRADSLAFDFHKWLHVPYEAGCVLIRDAEHHRRTFSPTGAYLARLPRGLASGPWFNDHGVQLSRGFAALKVWMLLKEHGIDRYRQLIEQNVAQARYLTELIEAAPDLQLLAPTSLNVVCFRYRAARFPEARLDELNRELLMRLHESGVAVPSYTTLDGRFAIRVAITNHRSRRADFALLVREVARLGARVAREYAPGRGGAGRVGRGRPGPRRKPS